MRKQKLQGIRKVEIEREDISKEYLMWFLSREEVKNYLSLFSIGNYIKFVPTRHILDLMIPIPKAKQKIKFDQTKLSKNVIENPINKVREQLFIEYNGVKKEGNKLSSLILASSICELILISNILEAGIKEKHLENYRGMGQLAKLAQIERVMTQEEVKDFINIGQIRNNIHPDKMRKTLEKQGEEGFYEQINEGLKIFDKILSLYGL